MVSFFNRRLFFLDRYGKSHLRTDWFRNHLSHHFSLRLMLYFLLAIIATAVVWNLPLECFGIEGLNIIQRRIIAIFVFAIIMWVTECIPSWATSVVLIALLLFATSDSALNFYTSGLEKSEMLSHKVLMATFADPIIILFLGGFVLAIAPPRNVCRKV